MFTVTHLWSIETKLRSSLCFDLNMTSLWGISNKEGGPNGVHIANRAKGGSSSFLFWPWRILILPLISSLCGIEGKNIRWNLNIQKFQAGWDFWNTLHCNIFWYHSSLERLPKGQRQCFRNYLITWLRELWHSLRFSIHFEIHPITL